MSHSGYSHYIPVKADVKQRAIILAVILLSAHSVVIPKKTLLESCAKQATNPATAHNHYRAHLENRLKNGVFFAHPKTATKSELHLLDYQERHPPKYLPHLLFL